ncbi:MAG: ABC transporter permease [Microthrixaceae bacterium]
MREFVGFTITGLVTASIYAIVASGLTLTYATTGIFNWAHGAFAAIGAFAYWQLTSLWGWPSPLALVVCVAVIGPLLGLVVEAGIMRRLEGTNEITRMAVTLALLVGIIAGINWIWDPRIAKVVLPMFNGRAVHIVGQRLPVYDLLVMGIALIVGAVIRWLLYRNRVGIQMRGIVDDRTLVILNGVSPIRTAQMSWIIGSTTAVLAGVLIAPKTSISAASLALLIMNAFAAAVVGRLRNLPLTILGAVILGLTTAYAQGYIGSRPDFVGGQYLIGLVNVVPVVVLFIALQFLPQERLRAGRSRQARELSTTPSWRGSAVLVLAVVLVTVAITPLLAPGDLHSMTKVWGIALIALSLVPLLGWAGRLAVCPFAFAAVGALLSAHLSPGGQIWGLVIAGVGAALVGALLSFPGARLSPLYLALATAAFAVALDNWIFRLPPFDLVLRIPFTDVTLYRQQIHIFQGGALSVQRPSIFGFDLGGDHAYFIFSAVVFAAAVLLLTALRRSDLGLRMLALKDSPIGYATVGLNRQVTTVAAFAISAGVAGVGGALYGAAMQRPSPDAFNFFGGLSILVVVVVFGVSSLGSPVAAGAFLAAPFLVNIFPSLAQVTPTMTAAAGVGLGDNPNGAIPSNLRPGWAGLLRQPQLLWGGLAALAVVYFAALTGVISNWMFAGFCVVFVVVMPAASQRIAAQRRVGSGLAAGVSDAGLEPAAQGATRSDGLADSPEHLALSLPLSSTDVAALDDMFGITTGAGRGS